MNNYSYAEGFTVTDKNKPKNSGTVNISHHETTVLGSEETTQVFPCPTEEPTKEPPEEPIEDPIHETTVSGSEDPIQVFPCPPKEPLEEPLEEPTEEPTEEPIEEPIKETTFPPLQVLPKGVMQNPTTTTPPLRLHLGRKCWSRMR